MTNSDLQPGPEADARIAQAMGWITGDDGTGRTTWFDPRNPDVEIWPCPGFTTDDRWIGLMLEWLTARCNSVNLDFFDDDKWRICGWIRPGLCKASNRQVIIEAPTLHEAVWRCLLAVAERESERP